MSPESRCTPRRAPSTCSFRGSSRATWSSCATASTTWRRGTSSPTTSARSSTCKSASPVEHAEYVLITPKDRASLRRPSTSRAWTRRSSSAETSACTAFAPTRWPALTPEPAMPPWPEVLGFVHVSTYPRTGTTWAPGTGASASDQFDLDESHAQAHQDDHRRQEPTREKVEAVYDWVDRRTRATWRSSSASTATSRAAACRRWRAVGATAKTRRR